MSKFSYVEAFQKLVVSFNAGEGEIKVLEKLLEKKKSLKEEKKTTIHLFEKTFPQLETRIIHYIPTELLMIKENKGPYDMIRSS